MMRGNSNAYRPLWIVRLYAIDRNVTQGGYCQTVKMQERKIFKDPRSCVQRSNLFSS